MACGGDRRISSAEKSTWEVLCQRARLGWPGHLIFKEIAGAGPGKGLPGREDILSRDTGSAVGGRSTGRGKPGLVAGPECLGPPKEGGWGHREGRGISVEQRGASLLRRDPESGPIIHLQGRPASGLPAHCTG